MIRVLESTAYLMGALGPKKNGILKPRSYIILVLFKFCLHFGPRRNENGKINSVGTLAKQISARNCYTNWKNTQSTKIHLHYNAGDVEMHLIKVGPGGVFSGIKGNIQIE